MLRCIVIIMQASRNILLAVGWYRTTDPQSIKLLEPIGSHQISSVSKCNFDQYTCRTTPINHFKQII